MTDLRLRYEACVRSLSISSSCTVCKEACPEAAITTDGARLSVVVHLERCTGCGVCSAACPTDAFDPPFDLERFVAESGPELRCGEGGLPCVGALSVEDLVALAARHRRLDVHDGACASRAPGHARAADNVEEARRVAAAFGLRTELSWVLDPELEAPLESAARPEPVPEREGERISRGRRQLLRMIVPPLEDRSPPRLEAPLRLDRARMQQVPLRRRRLLASLPSSVEARPAALPTSELSFFSSKSLSAQTCTACSVCVMVCPTGALQAPRSFREIRFDTSRCTKCGLCHEVCEPGAITLAETASLEDFLEFAPRQLSRLPVAPCVECGARFRRERADQNLCPRCEDMDQEARELTGVKS